jgi:single-strand DNA-binding protein
MNEGEITVVGNLTRDPELRIAASGTEWATFSVAVNRRRTGRDGNVNEKVWFVNCKVFGQSAANLVNSTAKGQRLVVSGHFETEEYKATDGTPRKSDVLVVDEVAVSLRFASAVVTGNPRQGGTPAYGNGAQASATPAATPAAAPASAGPDPFAADEPF